MSLPTTARQLRADRSTTLVPQLEAAAWEAAACFKHATFFSIGGLAFSASATASLPDLSVKRTSAPLEINSFRKLGDERNAAMWRAVRSWLSGVLTSRCRSCGFIALITSAQWIISLRESRASLCAQ